VIETKLLQELYHPQSNGKNERTNQNVKQVLKALVLQEETNWPEILQRTIGKLRCVPNKSRGNLTPHEMMFGTIPK
jgi:hypothetical protein